MSFAAWEPVGPRALAALAAELFGDADPLPARGTAPVMTVTPLGDSGYRLALPLPCAQRDSLSLARSGDDLVIALGSHRRRLALPAVLRRCAVTGARFSFPVPTADGGAPQGVSPLSTLLVDFAPDPGRWPAALAARLPAGARDEVDAAPGARRRAPMAAAR